MATPANILSTLVKIEGIGVASAQLREYDALSKKTSVGADKFTSATTAQGKAAKGTGKHLGNATKAVGGMLGAFAGFSVIKSSVNATADFTKATIALSKNFGLTTKSASEWAAVAQSRGLNPKQLTLGFKTFSTQIKSAGDGSAKSADMFKSLGLSQQDLSKHGNDLNYMLAAVSDGLAKLPPGTNKAAVMSKLFGRSWQQLAPVLRGGSKEMNNQLNLADKYGATLGGSTKSTEQMIAKQREFKLATLGLQLTLGKVLIPVLTAVMGVILKVVTAFREAPASIKIAALALLGLSAAFLAFNKVVEMSTVGRIAMLLLALGTALVLAYQRSQTFRDVVSSVFQTVQNVAMSVFPIIQSIVTSTFNAIMWAYTNVLKPVFDGIVWIVTNIFIPYWTAAFAVISTIAKVEFGAVSWAWNNLLKPVFNGIVWTLTNLVIPAVTFAFGAFRTIIGGAFAAVKLLWDNVLHPVFDAIVWVLKNILIPYWTTAFNFIKGYVSIAFTAIKFVWDSILHPVFDAIVWVLKNILIPYWTTAFNFIKSYVSTAFNLIKFVWDNVLHPVFNAIMWVIKTFLVPAFRAGFDLIKGYVSTAISGIKFVWDNVLHPVFNAIMHIISVFLVPAFRTAFNIIKGIVSTAFDAIKAVWDSVLHPVFNTIGNALRTLGGVFRTIFDAIKKKVTTIFSEIKGFVTGLFDGFWTAARNLGKALANPLIRGLNWILQKGWDFIHLVVKVINAIPLIPNIPIQGKAPVQIGEFAKGGKVNKPMAIVGEEAPRHPEYVIATNPAYRNRNQGLWAQAGEKLGMPGFATGGVVVRGPVSEFGPPLEGAGSTAYGRSSADPGLSLRLPGTDFNDPRNRFMMGKWFDVSIAGHHARLMDIDLGPASWTGKNIDVTGAGTRVLGFNPYAFPTGAIGTAELVGGPGPGGSVIDVAGFISGIPKVLGDIVSGGVGFVRGMLNKVVPKPPDWMSGIVKDMAVGVPKYIIDKTVGWVVSKAKNVVSDLFASGGGGIGAAGGPQVVGGNLAGYPELNGTVRGLLAALLKQWPGLSIGTTTNHSKYTTSGNISDHYYGHAADVVGSQSLMDRAGAWAQQNIGHAMKQGIHNPSLSINRGQVVPASYWGSSTWAGHHNHLHIAGYRMGGVFSDRNVPYDPRYRKELAKEAEMTRGFALGGNWPGGWGMVGERGPELAHLPQGTRIFSNDTSQGMVQPQVTLNFAPGTEWLRDFVQVEVSNGMRKQTRPANRGLAGRGGGHS